MWWWWGFRVGHWNICRGRRYSRWRIRVCCRRRPDRRVMHGGRFLRLGMPASAAKHGAVKVVPTKVAHYDRSHSARASRQTSGRVVREVVGAWGRVTPWQRGVHGEGARNRRRGGGQCRTCFAGGRRSSYRSRARVQGCSDRLHQQSCASMPSYFLPWPK